MLMVYLVFGDLDFIFKVIALQMENLLNLWMDFLQTCIDISVLQA